jgi:hypothetical protein
MHENKQKTELPVSPIIENKERKEVRMNLTTTVDCHFYEFKDLKKKKRKLLHSISLDFAPHAPQENELIIMNGHHVFRVKRSIRRHSIFNNAHLITFDIFLEKKEEN